MSPSKALDWDYTDVACAYLARPGYAPAAIDAVVAETGVGPGARACDLGAGTGTLATALAERGLAVVAVEPNAAMRSFGVQRSASREIAWCAMRAEAIGLRARSVDLVTFGSSLNVVAHAAALRESARILRPGGSVACLWNHRRLDDPLQHAIEELIRGFVPGYAHGARREDPSDVLRAGGFFEDVRALAADVTHRLSTDDFTLAWQSHLTLRRQAGPAFPDVLLAIRRLVAGRAERTLEVPYTTRGWVARLVAR